jgi:predicted amidohydrolase
MVPKLRIALCQMTVGVDKALNISRASAALASAAVDKKSNFVVLPECWNCPYSTSVFAEYAEYVPKVGEIPDAVTSNTARLLYNIVHSVLDILSSILYIYVLIRTMLLTF